MSSANRAPTTPLLHGQTALVTGSSDGIGRGIALELARSGADVVVNYSSSPDKAEETAAQVRALGRRAVIAEADVSSERDVFGLFAKARESFGTIDILVNNAGIQVDAPTREMRLEDWNRVIGVNLTGQFLCAREAIKEFERRGKTEHSVALGKIVCISSVHDVIPWAGHVNYAASKGGVMMLMKTLAQEVAPVGIRVNSVSPGAIRTSINEEAWASKEAERELLKLIPYKRVGDPADVGRLVAWLVSDQADYITGATLYVDGGMTLYPGFESGG